MSNHNGGGGSACIYEWILIKYHMYTYLTSSYEYIIGEIRLKDDDELFLGILFQIWAKKIQLP